ncbi:MAG: leucine-rich repeat domain-containing protein [Clostridia bacterium]|nr:leucine-rich repeat domain-containing protein [Clostridia bacterium]
MKKLLAILLTLLLSVSLLPAGLAIADTEGGYNYLVSNGEATIMLYRGAGGDIEIPSTLGGYPVTSISESAFEGCNSLTSVIIPDSVTSIGSLAFGYCTTLTSVIIPDSVTDIGDCAFDCCPLMASITVDDNNPNYKDIDGVLFSKNGDTLIQYPGGKVGSIYTIPDGVTNIGNRSFSCSLSLTSVIIPDSVAGIGNGAFYSCVSLTSITFEGAPPSVSDVLPFETRVTLYYYPDYSSQWAPNGATTWNGYNIAPVSATIYLLGAQAKNTGDALRFAAKISLAELKAKMANGETLTYGFYLAAKSRIAEPGVLMNDALMASNNYVLKKYGSATGSPISLNWNADYANSSTVQLVEALKTAGFKVYDYDDDSITFVIVLTGMEGYNTNEVLVRPFVNCGDKLLFGAQKYNSVSGVLAGTASALFPA